MKILISINVEVAGEPSPGVDVDIQQDCKSEIQEQFCEVKLSSHDTKYS